MKKGVSIVGLGLVSVFLLGTRPAAAAGNASAGAQVYRERNCQECHGKQGQGDGYILAMLKVEVTLRDWTDKNALTDLTDEDLAKSIVDGGRSAGALVMPKYGDKVSAEQVQDLVA